MGRRRPSTCPRERPQEGPAPPGCRIPASRTGRDKSHCLSCGVASGADRYTTETQGLGQPWTHRKGGDHAPRHRRRECATCGNETCRYPQLPMSHLGGGSETRPGSLCEGPSKLPVDLRPPSLPLPPGCPRHPLPARLQGRELLRVSGVPPALNSGLSDCWMPKSLSWT